LSSLDMNTFFVLAVVLFGALASAQDDWILVFNNSIPEHRITAHINRMAGHIFANYSIGDSFRGYAARLTKQQITSALASGEIAYAEPDQMMYATQTCKTQTKATWGINRISERNIQLNGNYNYAYDGAGVQAFIIDTGVLTTHTEFGGRAVFGANYAGDGKNQDCNGHGTHVAGTVGGTTYGVAKKVTIIGVKVLGCSGSGTNAGVISGIQWAANNKNGKPSVANMSLGGGYSKATNDAVAAAVKAGIAFAVAAGNENQDACNTSPASEPTAITVGSTDVTDKGKTTQEDVRSSFSNWGKCVKILAPGSLITSAWYTSNTAINTISGTSMASPHVAGAAAVYLGANPNATPAQVLAGLVAASTDSVVDLACSSTACRNTPNKLLFSSC
jgi:subtilisin family serine protease